MDRFTRIFSISIWTLMIACFAPTAFARAPLSASLEADGQWFENAGELSLYFSLTNTSDRNVYVLEYQTPLAGIEANIFRVERDGEEVPYIGKLYKRATPTAEEYLELRPGQTLTATVTEMSATYDMSEPGSYSVRYEIPVFPSVEQLDRRAGNIAADQAIFLPGIETERVEFWADGPFVDLNRRATAVADQAGDQFTACRPRQQTQLLTALDNAAMLANRAVAHLDKNPNGDELYRWWFGDWTASRFQTVDSHFDAISDALNNKPVTFNCACFSPSYAYVYPNEPYEIHLCRAFWRAPALGRDSQAGTLVHESSHFYVVASTDDYVYGATDAHNLATTNPTKAIDNADNHEYFAEDQY